MTLHHLPTVTIPVSSYFIITFFQSVLYLIVFLYVEKYICRSMQWSKCVIFQTRHQLRMPLILTHLEAEAGSASHWQHLAQELGVHLAKTRAGVPGVGVPVSGRPGAGPTDLTICCQGGVSLPSHQAVLAPLSPLLRNMFSSLCCPHSGLAHQVTILLDANPEVSRRTRQ